MGQGLRLPLQGWPGVERELGGQERTWDTRQETCKWLGEGGGGAEAAVSAAIHSGVQCMCLTLPVFQRIQLSISERPVNPKESKGEREQYKL